MPKTTTPTKLYRIQDIPRPQDMREYLARIQAICSIFPTLEHMPDVPPDMDHFDYHEANDVETILLRAEMAINSISGSWIYSGEFESGGI